MMMRYQLAVLPALLLSGACMESKLEQVELCDLANSHRQVGLVRMHVQVVVSNHGSYLVDPDCPDAVIAWEDSEQLSRAPEYEGFRHARRDVMFIDERGPLAIAADVEGEFRIRANSETGVLRVSRVHSFDVVPSAVELALPDG